MFSKEQIAELRELEKEATPGPWMVSRDTFEPAIYTKLEDGCKGMPICKMATLYSNNAMENAHLIAAMRNALPDLIDTAEEGEQLKSHVADVMILAHDRLVDSLRFDLAASQEREKMLREAYIAEGLKVSQFVGIMGDKTESEDDRTLAQVVATEHMNRIVERLQNRKSSRG